MKCVKYVKLFEDKPKIRRLTNWEQQEEKEDAKHWCRPVRSYWGDKPIYPWCPPEPYVNFELNYPFK